MSGRGVICSVLRDFDVSNNNNVSQIYWDGWNEYIHANKVKFLISGQRGDHQDDS